MAGQRFAAIVGPPLAAVNEGGQGPLYNRPVAEVEHVRRTAERIIREVQREFPNAALKLDFDYPRQEHEDAYLWVSAPDAEDEEVSNLWGFLIELVQRAFQEEDVYLVARMQGRTVIRDRPMDKE